MTVFNWTPNGEHLDQGKSFTKIEPLEVLYKLDSPMIFSIRQEGRLLLAYMCGEAPQLSRFVVVPTSQQILNSIKDGGRSVREALEQPWCWCVDAGHDGAVHECWVTSLDDIPSSVLPALGVMLDPSLSPVFSVRVEGRSLSKTNVPASAIKRAVDGAYIALKKLSEAHGTGTIGRPAKAWKQLFDLPTQRLALGSFEISFGEPKPDLELLPGIREAREALDSLGKNLGEALAWAVSKTTTSPEPSQNLLEALQKLVPPTHGVIETVRIGGSILGSSSESYVLDRRISKKVRITLAQTRSGSELIKTLEGEARELDKDRLSFRLQTAEAEDAYTCFFEEDLYDDVMDAFAEDQTMVVSVRLQRGARQAQVIAISPGPTTEDIQPEETSS